jgi:hypothetical protein
MDTANQVTIVQGVWGTVRLWEGDFMPPFPTGTITPVQREICVYEATRYDSVEQIVGSGGFYKSIFTKRVARTKSNAKGFYEVALPPGRYSVFVLEDTLFYSNEGDGAGYLTPVTVLAGKTTERRIDISSGAAF